MTNIIPIGCDHAGFELKEHLKAYLTKKGYAVKDFGCHSSDRVDYPDFGHKVAEHVSNNRGFKGIVICGSGNGINMSVNKHGKIRSALCWNNETVELARQHNDANMLAMPARFISNEEAIEMVDLFLNTEFEGGRHLNRVNKIPLSQK